MNSEFVTSNIAVAVTICYLYGSDSLVKINLNPDLIFTFSAPAEDCKIIEADFSSPDGLAISNLDLWYKEHARLQGSLRAMKYRNQTSWVSRYWVQGIDKEGNKIK